VKTDKRDSAILAEIGTREGDLPNSFNLDRKGLALRKRMRLIYTVSKQLQNLNSCLNEHKKTLAGIGEKMSPMESGICEAVKQLTKQKDRLEQELENDIRIDEKNAQKAEKYESIPGVSPYVAALATLIFSDEHSQSAKQWIAFVGLDVSIRQSGTWNGKGHLTKRGNNYLRMRFYTAAWGAIMHSERFREYYDHLRKKNRKHKEALVIIARKIINIMFSLVKHNSMYNENIPVFGLQEISA
jgi:transposase